MTGEAQKKLTRKLWTPASRSRRDRTWAAQPRAGSADDMLVPPLTALGALPNCHEPGDAFFGASHKIAHQATYRQTIWDCSWGSSVEETSRLAVIQRARVLANRLDRGFVRNAGLRLSAQAKEAGPVPGRSGDPARDGREAGMDLSLPMKAARHDHDLMQRAAMLADHDGPHLEMPYRLAPAPGQPIQELAGTGVELAEPLLLELMRTWGQACRATGPGAGCGGPLGAR